MTKRKIFSIVGIISVIGLVVLAVLVTPSNTPQPESQQEQEASEDQDRHSSMHDDHSLSEDDIKTRNSIDNFAKQSVINHLKEKYPDNINITIVSVEWYFTEENSSDNILVRAKISTAGGDVLDDMYVAEVEGMESGNFSLISIYKPDDRYSIYE